MCHLASIYGNVKNYTYRHKHIIEVMTNMCLLLRSTITHSEQMLSYFSWRCYVCVTLNIECVYLSKVIFYGKFDLYCNLMADGSGRYGNREGFWGVKFVTVTFC